MNTAENWSYSSDLHCVQDAHDLIVAFMPAARGEMFAVVNGPLIAAAPDLYSALTGIVASLAMQDDEGLIEHAPQMSAARAALAKAESRL